MRLTNKPAVGRPADDNHGLDLADAERVLETLGLAKGGSSGSSSDDMDDGGLDELDQRRSDYDDAPRSRGQVLPSTYSGQVQTFAVPSAIRRRANSRFAEEMRLIVDRLSGTPCAPNMPRKITVAALGTEGDGAALCASLAVTCSAGGYQVLLVDGNIDRPRLHEMFGVSNEVGLSNLLGDRYPPNHLPQPTSIPNLALITAGPRVSNHASLFLRERVLHRLDPIARAFDFIILDCTGLAPTLVARSGNGSDNVIVAVKRHESSMRALQNLVGALAEEGIENPSVVMIE